MSLKGKLEAIIYAAEEPVTVDQMAVLLREMVLAELASEATAQEASTEGAVDENTDAALAPINMPSAAPDTSEPTADGMLETADADAAALSEPTSKKKTKDPELSAVKAKLRIILAELVADYQTDARGVEIRQVAGGYRMATKPEHHDVVVGFAKSLKPPIRLSLQALETLAVVAYKQPITAPEVSEIRGVDSSGVIATLLDRKLITTAGRKQVIGRPILYKTTKEFLLRFGLKDVNELPSMEEFEKLGEAGQGVLLDLEATDPSPAAIVESAEANQADDAMMAREDDMVAEASASDGASHLPQAAVPESAPGEEHEASADAEDTKIENV